MRKKMFCTHTYVPNKKFVSNSLCSYEKVQINKNKIYYV